MFLLNESRFKATLFLTSIFFSATAYSQCPIAAFTASANVCSSQQIRIANTTSGATAYAWDFCSGDLENAPNVNQISKLSGLSDPLEGLTVVQDQGNWYGFAVARTAIARIDFGSNLGNTTPAINYLGTLGDILQKAISIKILLINSNWYGLVLNTDASDGNLIRLDFGTSLSNTPIATIIYPGLGSSNSSMDAIAWQGEVFVTVTSFNNIVTNVVFGNGLANPSTSTNTLSVPGVSSFIDIKLIESCGSWHAITIDYFRKIFRLDYSADFSIAPTSVDITGSISFISGVNNNHPYRLSVNADGGKFYGAISTDEGPLFQIDFGTNISNMPTSTSWGDFNILANGWTLALAKSGSRWFGFTANGSPGYHQLYQLSFPETCSVNSPVSSQYQPKDFSYNAAGTYKIALTAYASSGASSTVTQTTTVTSLVSPDISFTSQNVCVNNNVNFTSVNLSGDITGYTWDFGDGGNSSNPNPSYSYAIASTYLVNLTVIASNGCQNFAQTSLQIYNEPIASFNLPTSSPICSNQNYSFTNTTIYDVGSNPTWQWSVNGTNVATTQDLNYLIPSTAAQSIILTASIPGCNSQSVQSISTVQDGPLVNFNSPLSGCVNSPVTFINTSTGTITSFNWTFGDGNISSQANGSNSYASSGNFHVTLTASNTAGCQNFLTKDFSVYSNPQPDFVIEAPPYSCANYPAQFDNNTLPLTDSNITSWAWSFGDAANGTSSQKNPSYMYTTAANYNVILQATSNFGCTAAKQKSVTINPSPTAGFINSPACVNQNTVFTDASTGNITSYQWLIQGTAFTGANPPPYVFKSAGTYPVSLTTTSGNGCKNQLVKNIIVPIPPVMDFTYQPPCTGKPTTFQELNPGGADPSIAWNWNFGSGGGVGSPIDYSFIAPGVYLVTLSATRSSGCLYSTSKNVTIYNGPIAMFTPSTQSGAPPLPVTFNNESTADSYFWQFGSGNLTSTEVSPVYTYNELGEYKVLLTANNIHGCADTTSTKIYVVVPRIDIAMKNFSLVEDPNSNASKPVVTISNLGNIPLTNPEVQIDLGGHAVLNEKIALTVLPGRSIQQTLSLEIVPQTLGYICAEVASAGDINIYNDRQCLSMTNNDVLFYPYPNPAKGQINFDWISSESENVVVTIFRSTGQVAFKQDFQMVQPGINQLAIDISSLSSGLYMIQFSGSKAKKTFSVSVIN